MGECTAVNCTAIECTVVDFITLFMVWPRRFYPIQPRAAATPSRAHPQPQLPLAAWG
jgi:hypothetical protein